MTMERNSMLDAIANRARMELDDWRNSLAGRINAQLRELRNQQEAEAARLLATVPPGKRLVIEIPEGGEWEWSPATLEGDKYVCRVRWLGRFRIVNAEDAAPAK